MRNNRLTVDDASRQTLTMEEIEELKKAGTGSGKDIIAKIMASHQAISEKTAFSLAKYTLRKSRKFLRRFTALPLDVRSLTEHILEKEAYRIMELREETLALLCSWANVHCSATSRLLTAPDGVSQVGGGRWLVVDDTGGLVVAALAEKMGLLYPPEESDDTSEEDDQPAPPEPTASPPHPDTAMPDADASTRPRKPPRPHIPQMSAYTNTLTVLHPNNQPNLACLKYFGFDVGQPSPAHPLYKHLKSLSWLTLLAPEDDPSYIEPELLSPTELDTMKSSKRGNYYKKRRRWEKTVRVVDETKRGGFDGLVVATSMDVRGVLRELVPLVKGGGKVVVYHPNAEPLVELVDCYSKERRAAFVAREFGDQAPRNGSANANTNANGSGNGNSKAKGTANNNATPRGNDGDDDAPDAPPEDADFPVNPTLLLAPSLQTARARQWQVLPERTHPMMTSKGGAEGYLFTATRVIPVEGKVEARGHGTRKKRKTAVETPLETSAAETPVEA